MSSCRKKFQVFTVQGCSFVCLVIFLTSSLPINSQSVAGEQSSHSHLLVLRGGEGQNGEDGFKIDRETVVVREEMECAHDIPSPVSENDTTYDVSSLGSDELVADIKLIWEKAAQILKDLRSMGLGQTADYMGHFFYQNRINWCFTKYDLREVVDEGEYDSAVDAGHLEGLTVGLNHNDMVYLSLSAWKMMKGEMSKRKTFLHEFFWTFLREAWVNNVNTIVRLVNHFDQKNLASKDIQGFVYQTARLLPNEESLLLKLMLNDLEINGSEKGDLKAKLNPRLILGTGRPIWDFLQVISLRPAGHEKEIEVMGANPKASYQKLFVGDNKVLKFEGSRGQVLRLERENLSDLCGKGIGEQDEANQWKLLTEIELDGILRNNWNEFLIDPILENDLVLVASQHHEENRFKVLDPETLGDVSDFLTDKNKKFLKYFCARSETIVAE